MSMNIGGRVIKWKGAWCESPVLMLRNIIFWKIQNQYSATCENPECV